MTDIVVDADRGSSASRRSIGRRAARDRRAMPWCSPPAAPASSTGTPPTRRSAPATVSPPRSAPGPQCATSSSTSSTPPRSPYPATRSVSEAVRGEGAVLLDARGDRFMLDEHPDAELAPRDVVARAIAEQMARQDGAAGAAGRHRPRPCVSSTQRFPGDHPHLPRGRLRLGQAAGAGHPGRALLDGRRPHRRLRAHLDRRTVRRRRGRLHRRARRQPAGLQLAARGARVRVAQRGRARRPPRWDARRPPGSRQARSAVSAQTPLSSTSATSGRRACRDPTCSS